LLHHSDALGGHVITVQVMAVADVSAAHKDPIRALLEGLEDVMRRDGGGAHDANVPDVGRILESAYAGEVRPGIGAPIAEER
jgi:hypothetical protein